jgi:transcriptional regulator with XRE-family HTH domain
MGEIDKPAARLLKNKREARRSKRAIGERLKLARHLLGKSQKDFATDAGIAGNTYNQYETGTNTPSLEEAQKLCDRWALTLDWIYRGDTRGLGPDLSAAIEAMQRARS